MFCNLVITNLKFKMIYGLDADFENYTIYFHKPIPTAFSVQKRVFQRF